MLLENIPSRGRECLAVGVIKLHRLSSYSTVQVPLEGRER